MEPVMMENSLKDNEKVKELILGQTRENILDNGKMGNKMVKE